MLSIYKNKLEKEGQVYLLCKVFPNSNEIAIKEIKKSNIEGKDIEMILMSIKASPVKNKANKEIINFFSKEFKVNIINVLIINGSTDRVKLIKIKK